jgi:uncharacterized protein (DUF1778 family)
MYGNCVYDERMPKTKRVDLRIDDDDDQMIRQAAEVAGMTVSHFMVVSAREKAEQILVDRAFHLLDEGAWDQFVARLESPPRYKPELAKLFVEPDVFAD